jgi:hypothetical protein
VGGATGIRAGGHKISGPAVVGFDFMNCELAPDDLQECEGLERSDFKSLAAADVATGDEVVFSHHVGLSLGETGAVSLVGVSGQLGPFAPHDPVDLVVAGLAAVRTNEGVCPLLIGFGKKIAFFHHWL